MDPPTCSAPSYTGNSVFGVSIETYALLDSGSDNTQITRTIADALGIRDKKSVTIPVASLYQGHTIETTEIFHEIGDIDSSRPIINLPVFATSTTDFQIPTVPIQMINSVCKDFGHLSGINFSQIRDNRIGILYFFYSNSSTQVHNRTTGNTVRSSHTIRMDNNRTSPKQV